MKVGDLVYVPYFEDYGIIIGFLPNNDYNEGSPLIRVAYPCGYECCEYEEDMEAVCK